MLGAKRNRSKVPHTNQAQQSEPFHGEWSSTRTPTCGWRGQGDWSSSSLGRRLTLEWRPSTTGWGTASRAEGSGSRLQHLLPTRPLHKLCGFWFSGPARADRSWGWLNPGGCTMVGFCTRFRIRPLWGPRLGPGPGPGCSGFLWGPRFPKLFDLSLFGRHARRGCSQGGFTPTTTLRRWSALPCLLGCLLLVPPRSFRWASALRRRWMRGAGRMRASSPRTALPGDRLRRSHRQPRDDGASCSSLRCPRRAAGEGPRARRRRRPGTEMLCRLCVPAGQLAWPFSGDGCRRWILRRPGLTRSTT